MFFPLKTEAHDGRIRLGSLGIILICLLVHIMVSRDQAARLGRFIELEEKLRTHKAEKGVEDLLKEVGGEGLLGERESGHRPKPDDSLALIRALQEEYKRSLMYRLGLVPGDFNPVNLITNLFTHADWMHLIFNMWFFYIVGVTMEKFWGMGKFLGIYLGCGVAGSVLFMLLSRAKSQGVPLVGASGAIAGMMGAFATTHGDAKVTIFWLLGFRGGKFDIPARWYLGFWVAGQVLDCLLHMNQAGGVAYSAHVAGFAAGIVAGKLVPGDVFYQKAYVPEFTSETVDMLVSDKKLDVPKPSKPPEPPPHQDGSDVTTLLNRGLHALENGDPRVAGEHLCAAVEKALTLPDVSPALVEATVMKVVEVVQRVTLPAGALYSWARKMEQRDWWQWAIYFYDSVAFDLSASSSAHARESSLFRAAVLRMDHGFEKEKARIGFEAVLRSQPEGALAGEARSRLTYMGM